MDIVTLCVLCLAVGGLAGVVAEILHQDPRIIFELGDSQAFARADPPTIVTTVAPASASPAVGSDVAAVQA